LSWNIIYDFLTGPALWFTFIFFIGGLLVRIAILFRLSRKKDQVVFNHISLGWGLRSILQWLIPGGSTSMRQQPVFTIVAFVFHLSLLGHPTVSGCPHSTVGGSFRRQPVVSARCAGRRDDPCSDCRCDLLIRPPPYQA